MIVEEEKKVPKVKINPLSRNLFPDLAKGLEEYGQLEPLKRTEDGITVDGTKRRFIFCNVLKSDKILRIKKIVIPVKRSSGIK